MSNTQTVTVLYYENELSMDLMHETLADCEVGKGGRVIIPNEFKDGKIIIAILKDRVKVLNTLGERAQTTDKNEGR